MNTLTIEDLNTTINHEPRILDVRIAELLEMAQPLNIRQVIESNKEELALYGEVFTDRVKTGKRGGRPSIAYYLNEAQTILLCLFSRTEKAAAIRKQVIDVFMAYRKGGIQPTELNLDDLITPHEQRMLQEAIKLKHEATGIPYPALYERIKNKFRIAKYNQCTRSQFAEVMFYVCNMESKQKALPAPTLEAVEYSEGKVNIAAAVSRSKQVLMMLEDMRQAFGRGNEALRSHIYNISQQVEYITDACGAPHRYVPAQVLPAARAQLLLG